MKTETEIEKQETEGEGTLPPSEGHKMQTYSRLMDEPDSDKLSRIESILDQISAKLGDEDENRAGYENMLDFFKSLKASSEGILFKLNHEIEYTRTLEEKLKRKNVEYDNLQLKKALLEEQGKMTIALENFQGKIDETLTSITASFNSMDKTIADNCSSMQQKADEIRSLKDEIDELITGYNKDLDKSATDQFKLLKNDCKTVLEDCNERVEEIKSNVLTFLKTCNQQNLELIKKIPEQKRKFCWLDAVVYAMCGVCIIGMVVQMVR